MAKDKCVPYGSDIAAGTYKCADCGHKYTNQSKTSLPPCPQINASPHTKKCWHVMTGAGDAVEDPYPEKATH
jgi:transposase-like protein